MTESFRNLPTLFIYGNGELQTQLLTMKQLGGAESNVNGTKDANMRELILILD